MTHSRLKRSLGLISTLLWLAACASTPPPEAPDL